MEHNKKDQETQPNEEVIRNLEQQYYVPMNDVDPYFKEAHQLIVTDLEEFAHFRNVVTSFYNYKHDSMREVDRIRKNFQIIGEHYCSFLKFNYEDRVQNLEGCIDKNHLLLCTIVDSFRCLFKFDYMQDQSFQIPVMNVLRKNVSKMKSTLRQFVRDWTKEGEAERRACYAPIIEELQHYYPSPLINGRRIKILVPGSGLGRLAFDFACKGYDTQGNEFSYFMLFAANYILNQVNEVEEWEIYPFIHNHSNLANEKDLFQSFRIPDVLPFSCINSDVDFSMVAGEFVEIYKMQKGEWDSVATCFFIDTAKNIVLYVETIYEILRNGGVWINFGPLLYHYSDIESECSIDLSWEELEHVIIKMGFEIKTKSFKKATYNQEPHSLMKVEYDCIFFTAVKVT